MGIECAVCKRDDFDSATDRNDHFKSEHDGREYDTDDGEQPGENGQPYIRLDTDGDGDGSG